MQEGALFIYRHTKTLLPVIYASGNLFAVMLLTYINLTDIP